MDTTIDLTGLNLTVGTTYPITVVAVADDYTDSEASNQIQYTR